MVLGLRGGETLRDHPVADSPIKFRKNVCASLSASPCSPAPVFDARGRGGLPRAGRRRLRPPRLQILERRNAARAARCTTARSARRRRTSKGIVRNAVLIGHGTGGSGAQFIRPEFAGELFGAGQPLDATKYFIVLPDGIGHGKSAKPSDGLRAKFPQYGYTDMVEAQYRLLTEGLGVNHLRLVMGTSMGGMHTWVWGERHPGFHGRADAAREPADADLRPQSRLAQDAHRCHSQRSRPGTAATTRAQPPSPAHRRRTHLLHGQQSGPAPGADADAREGRRSAGRSRWRPR